MKNQVVRIKLHIIRADGSRRFVDPIKSANGKLKPLCCLNGKESERHAEGVYYLRYLGTGGKGVYQVVGQDAELALLEKTKKEVELKARLHGLLVEDNAGPATTKGQKQTPASSGETLGEAIVTYMAEQTRLTDHPGRYWNMRELSVILRSRMGQPSLWPR